MMKTLASAALAVAMLAGTATVADARDWDNNPPGPRGGPGTNWENPPGWRGGPGASPDRRWLKHRHPVRRYNRRHNLYWNYYGFHNGWHWYQHPKGYWCRFDRDDNPPGPRGGPGTNWENPPGPRGGPGASPNSRYRAC